MTGAGRVIAVANMKGGVGKTTVVVGLAETMAAVGASVLVIDADAQANASVCLAGDQQLAEIIDSGRTLDAFLDEKLLGGAALDMEGCITPEVSRVTHAGRYLDIALLATSASLRLLERELIFDLTSKGLGLDAIVAKVFGLFRDQLAAMRKRYDFVLIDCAPGISVVNEASIRLADLVIVPTVPDFLSTYGLTAFCRTLWREPETSEFKPRRPPFVVASRRRPIKEHERYLGYLQAEVAEQERPFELFKTVIPEATALADALKPPEQEVPFTRKWSAPIVANFGKLTREVVEALRGS